MSTVIRLFKEKRLVIALSFYILKHLYLRDFTWIYKTISAQEYGLLSVFFLDLCSHYGYGAKAWSKMVHQ